MTFWNNQESQFDFDMDGYFRPCLKFNENLKTTVTSKGIIQIHMFFFEKDHISPFSSVTWISNFQSTANAELKMEVFDEKGPSINYVVSKSFMDCRKGCYALNSIHSIGWQDRRSILPSCLVFNSIQFIQFEYFVTIMCRNDELSWFFTNRLSANR